MTEALRVELKRVEPTVMAVVCSGQLRAEDTDYLRDLEPIVDTSPNKVSIMFHTLGMQGYSPMFPMGHVPFFKRLRQKLGRVAVVHSIASVRVAIATVSLATSLDIKGFDNEAAALAWIREGTAVPDHKPQPRTAS